MNVSIQIDTETAEKLLYIQQQTDRDRNEALQIAIADYYHKLIQSKKSPLQLVEAGFVSRSDGQKPLDIKLDDWSDFIGSIAAEPDLAKNHKSYLRDRLDKKYDHR